MIGLLVSIIIIAILGYFIFHFYFKSMPKQTQRGNEQILSPRNGDYSSYSETVKDAEKTVGEANKRILNQEKTINNLLDAD